MLLIDSKLLLEDLGEEPYIRTETDAEIQEHSDWLRFKEMIERQPTVDAMEVVHGHFEKITGGMVMLGNCSECNVRQPVIETYYCKNCGAKMDGDGNA